MSQINNTIGSESVPTSGAFVGYNAIITIAGTAVSRVQRMSFSVDNNITQVYVVSSRTPLNIETRLVIKGTIRRLFFNTAMLRLSMGVPVTSNVLPSRPTDYTAVGDLMSKQDTGTPFFASHGDYRKIPPIAILCQLNIENSTDTYYGIKLSNVKFDSYDMTIDANTVVLENVSFFAESIGITHAPVDPGGGGGGGEGAAAGE